MDQVFGLPAHPIVVHAAVVLVPLAAVGVVITAFWPAARSRLAIAVVVLAAAGVIATYLAVESGESLEDDVARSELVEDHAELGDSGLASASVVLLGALAVAGFGFYEDRRAGHADGSTNDGAMLLIRIGIGVVAVVLVTLGTLQIFRIGHSGAKAVWNDVGAAELSAAPPT